MPTFEEKIRALGGIELHRPKAAPDVAPANSARVYYDADQGALQVSNNGGAYSPFADLTAAGVTATATEINKLHGVIAGTSPASKVAVLGTNKNLDVLALPVSGLKIGAGAGTAVDATAAELNKTAGVTAGTVTASKALVVDANSRLDAVCVGTLALGAGAGTALTATAAEINKAHGVTGSLVEAQEASFTETSGAGTYTGSLTIPAGATILDIVVAGVAVWNNAGTATLTVGDVATPDGYFTAVNLKTTDLLAGESLSFANAGGKAGAYIANSQVSPQYSASARTVSGIIVTASTGGTLGRTRMIVFYVLPVATTAASKV